MVRSCLQLKDWGRQSRQSTAASCGYLQPLFFCTGCQPGVGLQGLYGVSGLTCQGQTWGVNGAVKLELLNSCPPPPSLNSVLLLSVCVAGRFEPDSSWPWCGLWPLLFSWIPLHPFVGFSCSGCRECIMLDLWKSGKWHREVQSAHLDLGPSDS